MKSNWSRVSIFYLFLVASIGTLLRAADHVPLPLQYEHLVHAHTHVAFQGWVYTLMFLLLTHLYLDQGQIRAGRYPLQFWLTAVVILCVLVSFAMQGYGLFSICFSTLFQLLNYWFIYRFFKDTKHLVSLPLRLIRMGLWLGVLSTLMPIGIGILSAKGLNGSEAYQSLVYTFLHLQYNGWFLFVLLGLFFQLLEKNGLEYDQSQGEVFYKLFTAAVLPAIGLSLLGMSFSTYALAVSCLAILLQLAAVMYFMRSIQGKLRTWLQQKILWFRLCFLIFLVSFLLKTVLQSLSVIPLFEPYAFHNKWIILSYLHLSLIGVISFFLIAFLIELKWICNHPRSKTGLAMLMLGFVVTELLLVSGGLGAFYDQDILISGSASMAVGVLLLAATTTPHQVSQ